MRRWHRRQCPEQGPLPAFSRHLFGHQLQLVESERCDGSAGFSRAFSQAFRHLRLPASPDA